MHGKQQAIGQQKLCLYVCMSLCLPDHPAWGLSDSTLSQAITEQSPMHEHMARQQIKSIKNHQDGQTWLTLPL